MGFQMRRTAEGLAAVGAFKWPVPAVDYLVCNHVGVLMEVLATGATSELPFLAVRGEVKGQMGGGDEGFGAQAAAVRVQASASAPMRETSAIRETVACLAGWTFGRTGCFVHISRGWRVG